MNVGSRFSGYTARLAAAFFQQLKACGQLGLTIDTDPSKEKEDKEAALGNLSGFSLMLMQVLETFADLRFDAGEVPYIYNRIDWPADSPPAGYALRTGSVRPSHVLKSLMGIWQQQWHYHSADSRTMAASLYLCQEENLLFAVRHLLDLQEHGFIIDGGTAIRTIERLLRARVTVSSDSDIPSVFCAARPKTNAGWLDCELRGDIDLPDISTANLQPILEPLIEDALTRVDSLRASSSYDDWLVRLCTVQSRLRTVLKLAQSLDNSLSLAAQAVVHQMGEIMADSGGALLVWMSNIQSPVQARFTQGRTMAVLLRDQHPKDWQEILINQRALIPRAIGKQLLEGNLLTPEPDLPLPAVWAGVSSSMFPAVSLVFHAGRAWPHWRREPRPGANTVLSPVGTINTGQTVDMPGEANGVDVLFAEVSAALEEASKSGTSIGGRVEQMQYLADCYPSSHILEYELAISLDEAGHHEKAWEHMIAATLAEPTTTMYWQSLGVILKRMGLNDDSLVSQGVLHLLSKRNS